MKKIVQGEKKHAKNEDETLPVHGKRSFAATNSSCSLTACSLVLPPRCCAKTSQQGVNFLKIHLRLPMSEGTITGPTESTLAHEEKA